MNAFHEDAGLWIGQFEARIRDLVSDCPECLAGSFVVIDVLDSTSPAASLSGWLRHLDAAGIARTVVDELVVIAPEAVPRLVAAGKTFHGFDQVWLCTRVPRVGEIPSGRFTSDVASFEKKAPGEVHSLGGQSWFTALLADGCGLNVATSSAGFRDRVTEWWSSLE